MDDVNEAHRMAALVFGLYRCRHFHGVDEKGTENADISMWQAGPNIRGLRSRSRKRLRDTGTGYIADRRDRQQRDRDTFLKSQQAERALLMDYLEKGQINIRELSPVPAKTRYFLLYWIGRCLANRSRQVFTPEGIRISLIEPMNRGRAILECEDGELDMPNYTLKFSGEVKGFNDQKQ